LIRSPVTGPAGNVEFLALLEKAEPSTAYSLEDAIRRVA
jgi:hypothetical protein